MDIINQFFNGNLNVNEFAVLVAVSTKAGTSNVVNTTSTEIASGLRGGLSRHAVARALRSLHKKQFLYWHPLSNGRSEIEVN
jgi:DNA-binding MarR family transcriptional regulator